GGVRISAEDIARATEQAFEDFQAERLMSADQDELMMVTPLKRDLRDLGDRQREITERIDAILNGDLTAKAAQGSEDIEIPGGERVDELVAQAIVKFRDNQEKERSEKRAKQREERAQKRRDELLTTLSTRLSLSGNQSQEVSSLMLEMEGTRDKIRQDMRAAREGGGDFDFRSMGETFMKLTEDANQKMNGILNPDQQSSYEDYKKENPWGGGVFGGGGGFRGMRGATGGGNRGGNR
ncbi:MAG: hypothetical protein ACI97A_004024, partial [Planctomycetota bacterium]